MSVPHLTAAQPPPTARIVKVTPKLAEEWIGRNTRNRHVRHPAVAAYARDMTAGAWHLNGESVKFSRNGVLLDGQHRLLAVIESGVTVPMLLVEGLPAEAQDTVDAGAKRTAADVLGLRSEQHAVLLAAIARRAIIWQATERREVRWKAGGGQVTHHEITAAIEADGSLRNAAEFASSNRAAAPAAIVGFCWWALTRIDAMDAEEFFAGLVHGEELVRGNPVLVLRDKLAEMRAASARTPDRVVVAVIFKAWNAYRKRDQIRLIRFTSNEKFPVPR